MISLRSTSQALAASILLAIGGGTAVALASGGGRDHPEDDGTTTAESTGTTTTGTTTTGSPTTPTTPTTPTQPGVPQAPRITEIEVDDAPGTRIRLRAEVQARGARVTSVRFTYRGRTYRATRSRGHWVRTVAARGGDHRDDAIITVRVRACATDLCTARTGRDDA